MLMMDFDTSFKCYKSQHSFLTCFQLWICQKKAIIHQGSCIFPDLILVINYHSYKEKTMQLLPYHSLSMEVTSPKKNWAPFSGSPPQKNVKPPGSLFSSILLKNFQLHLSLSLQHSTLNICGYYFFAEYKLVIC